MYEKENETENENDRIRAIIAGEKGSSLEELKSLCETLNFCVLHEIFLSDTAKTSAFGTGSGKAREISTLANDEEIDIIVFDFELDPRKQRNWESLAKIPVIDRNEVILRIFAERAQTREAVLQVQLAQLEYSLPRLAHSYGELSRQRGGNYGAKGSGETKLELDRRQVKEKMFRVKKQLEQVVKIRKTQHKKREKNSVPSVSLVGYTNAGKSTLLNALTGANVLAEDKLFATLDPTTRKVKTAAGNQFLLTDTVGFISNLPHGLVKAFNSTLEEAKNSSLLVVVLDSTDKNIQNQYETVLSVLEEIGADSVERIIALNKIDGIAENSPDFSILNAKFEDSVKISAREKTGLKELIQKVEEKLFK